MQKKMTSLTLSLAAIGALAYAMVCLSTETSSPINSDTLVSEFFWIGVFSLTAKAALSISYDDQEMNPIHCKIMCLVGLLYCFLVDKSLFSFTFTGY